MNEIQNRQALISIFGGWPSFHDAEVFWILLDRGGEEGPALTAKIHVFEGTKEVSERGYYVSKNHTLATLRFGGVELEYLENFNDQNVLFSLDIADLDPEESEGRCFEVVMSASYGCSAEFRCRTIEVTAVEPFEGF